MNEIVHPSVMCTRALDGSPFCHNPLVCKYLAGSLCQHGRCCGLRKGLVQHKDAVISEKAFANTSWDFGGFVWSMISFVSDCLLADCAGYLLLVILLVWPSHPLFFWHFFWAVPTRRRKKKIDAGDAFVELPQLSESRGPRLETDACHERPL
eukprot:3457054-Amphidinium_carterae.1